MSLGTAPYTPDVPLSLWERLTARWPRWRATRSAEELHADILHDFSLMSPEERDREIDRFLPPALRRYRNGGADPEVYATPAMVALRNAPGAALCSDLDCDLSGGWAHVGPCESCSCGAEHAVAECPEAA